MKLTGTVRYPDSGVYFIVECPQAPPHLRTLFLEAWAIRGAMAGDKVDLEYRKTGNGYQWVVTEVFR